MIFRDKPGFVSDIWMTTQKYVGYCRVSTTRQGRSGLGLSARQEAITEFAARNGVMIAQFTEIESGKKADRPVLSGSHTDCSETECEAADCPPGSILQTRQFYRSDHGSACKPRCCRHASRL